VDTSIQINGMSCAHCVAAVQKALMAVPGVTVREVAIGRAVVTLDAAGGSLAAVEAAIEHAGYDVVTGRVLNIAPAVTRDTTPDA
jgi:copper chaperone CopZ